MSTGILGCVWGLGNVIIIKEPTFLKFELTADSFKRFGSCGTPAASHKAMWDARGVPRDTFCVWFNIGQSFSELCWLRW